MREILLGAAVMNLLAFALFGADKAFARTGSRRVREADLFALAIAGGSLGAICGMYAFRHKTLKPGFRIGLPMILLVQILAAAYLLNRAGLAFNR